MKTLIENQNFSELEYNKWYWIKKENISFRNDRNIKLSEDQCVLVFLPEQQPLFDKHSFEDNLNTADNHDKKSVTVVVYQSKENKNSGRKKIKINKGVRNPVPSRDYLEASEELHPKNEKVKEFNNELIVMVNAYNCESVNVYSFGKNIKSIPENNSDFDELLYESNKRLYPNNKVSGYKNLRQDIAKGKPPSGDENRYYFDQKNNGDRKFDEIY